MRARYYDAGLGRFVSRDPIGTSDDVNLYRYVKNNPLRYTDVFGLAAKAFIVAYDEYRAIKGKIYNKTGNFDMGFVLLDIDEKEKLLEEYHTKREYAKGLHYARNKWNTDLPSSDEDAQEMGWIKLKNEKSALHQIGVPEDKWNEKWVSPNGSKEVIYLYDSNGDSIVNDETNIGTYNYFNPNGTYVEQYKHYDYDVKPYQEWGNGPNDISSKEQRSAWTREGVIKATY